MAAKMDQPNVQVITARGTPFFVGDIASRYHHRRKKRANKCTKATWWGLLTAVLLGGSGAMIYGLCKMSHKYWYIYHHVPNAEKTSAQSSYMSLFFVMGLGVMVFLSAAIVTGLCSHYYVREAADERGGSYCPDAEDFGCCCLEGDCSDLCNGCLPRWNRNNNNYGGGGGGGGVGGGNVQLPNWGTGIAMGYPVRDQYD